MRLNERKSLKALPNGLSEYAQQSLRAVADNCRGGFLTLAGDLSRDTIVTLRREDERPLIEVVFTAPMRDVDSALVIDFERRRLIEGARDGLATFAIYQAILAAVPKIISAVGEKSAKIIMDDANDYSWKRLYELFPLAPDRASIDMGTQGTSINAYHAFRLK